jgi:hypothetical protein
MWAVFMAVCAVYLVWSGPPIAKSESSGEKFSALAFMPSGMGPRMVGPGATLNLDIYINRYTTDAEAKQDGHLLIEKGSDALLKKLEDSDSIGKVNPSGRVGFFDLKLIRSRPIKGGRRIVGVSDRPIQFLEAYSGGRSLDYTFGIIILDLKTKDNGEEEGVGQLIYAAKVKVLKGNKIEVENYGVEPARLQGVRKL